MKYSTRQRWRWLVNGIYYRHPFCCVLRFSLGHMDNYGDKLGSRYTSKAGVYVPCHIFHFPNVQEDPVPLWVVEINNLSKAAIDEWRAKGEPGPWFDSLLETVGTV